MVLAQKMLWCFYGQICKNLCIGDKTIQKFWCTVMVYNERDWSAETEDTQTHQLVEIQMSPWVVAAKQYTKINTLHQVFEYNQIKIRIQPVKKEDS